MNRTRTYLLMLLALLAASCIRDDLEPCPPLNIMLSIEDKNYDNVATIEGLTGLTLAEPEDQPFRHYIQRLYYTLYRVDTREAVITKRLHDVQGDAAMATVYDIPADLPYGDYALVVWGNIDSDEGIQGDYGGIYDLHAGNVEGYDVYHGLLRFTYDEYNGSFICPLQRVKGQLLILTEGLPAGINWSRKAVTGLSGEATYDGSYTDGEVETVVTTRSWGTDVANPRSETVLAPTADGHSSTLYVRFYDHEDMQTPAIEPDALTGVDMQRNRITPVKYVFDNGKVYIYTLVDDNWKLTHGMGIE